MRQKRHSYDSCPKKIKKIFENPRYRGQDSKYMRKLGWVGIPTPFFLLPGSVAKNGPSQPIAAPIRTRGGRYAAGENQPMIRAGGPHPLCGTE